MVIDLSKFKDINCAHCQGELLLNRKRQTNFAKCKNCGTVWMLTKSKDNKILGFQCYDKDFLIEFNVELPFNLALPTGRYSYEKPDQIMIRRDWYYFQKGNELENVKTLQPFYFPQRETFDDFGLFREDHKDKPYKRKMRTVLFKRFPVSGIFREDIGITQILNSPYILETIFRIQVHFLKLINEFLIYYCNFFPSNSIKGLFQHEIRPISIYEFSKCLFNCRAIIDNQSYEMQPIIQDFTNLKAIPDITYLNENGKFNEFEKLLQNLQNTPILQYQQMFILARSLYRTNRNYMGGTIITMVMTVYEALLYSLEKNHQHFKNLKKVRNNLFKAHPGLTKPGTRSFSFLEFYTDYARPSIARLIKNNYKKNFIGIKEILSHLNNLNILRWIRNDIIHRAEFKSDVQIDYTIETGFKDIYNITYVDKKVKNSYTIDFSHLWESFLKIYDVLNKLLLKVIYPSINWEIDSSLEKEDLAMNTETGRYIISIVPNINWRETKSFNFTLEPPSVPPELFLINLTTNDNKEFSINLSKNSKDFERFSPIKVPINLSYKEIKKAIKQKNFFCYFLRNNPKIYSSCESCGYILPIHQHHICNNNLCPNCKTEFDIIKKWLVAGLNYLKIEKYNESIAFSKKVLEINPKHHDTLNNIGVCYIELKNYEEALKYLEKIELEYLGDTNRKITFLCHKAIAHYELNNKENCEDLLNTASLLNPNHQFLLLNQCIYLTNEKRIDKAMILCERLLKQDDFNPQLLYLKSRIMAQKHLSSKAIKLLLKAIELEPSLRKNAIEQADFDIIRDLDDFKKIFEINPKNT